MIAESFERIHRSNLVGMGVLPLQFLPGETAESLGLTGRETFTIRGLGEVGVGGKVEVEVDGGAKRFMTLARLDAPADVRVYRQGGLMQMMLSEPHLTIPRASTANTRSTTPPRAPHSASWRLTITHTWLGITSTRSPTRHARSLAEMSHTPCSSDRRSTATSGCPAIAPWPWPPGPSRGVSDSVFDPESSTILPSLTETTVACMRSAQSSSPSPFRTISDRSRNTYVPARCSVIDGTSSESIIDGVDPADTRSHRNPASRSSPIVSWSVASTA